tara:strand:+ start:254 stop:589 length:336 start_codon:yes stop_codon:yes gene_type:complete
MRFENRRWLVIPTSIIDDIDFDEVHESNKDSLRKSIDESKAFVKYEVNIVEETTTETVVDAEDPDVEYTVTTDAGTYGRPSIYDEAYTEYNHADILALLATSEWSLTETPE